MHARRTEQMQEWSRPVGEGLGLGFLACNGLSCAGAAYSTGQ